MDSKTIILLFLLIFLSQNFEMEIQGLLHLLYKK